MILNLEDTNPQTRYVPDVRGFNFSVLMPDLYSKKGLRAAPQPRPVSLGSLARLRAALTYCRNNPPDAQTVTIIQGRGDSVAYTDCGGPAQNQPVAAPTSVPVFNPAYPGEENCQPLDSACVQRNTARANANEDAFLQANENYETQLCIAQGGEGWVPAGEDVGVWCRAQYGGSGAAAAVAAGAPAPVVPVTKPNQSVPPTSQITTIPNLPTSPPTQQVLATAYTSGAAGPSSAPASAQLIPGIDNSKLLLGVGLAAVVLMAVKK